MRRFETRPVEMCIYTAKSPSVKVGRKSLLGNANRLIIEDIHSGNDIIDETGEIRVVWETQGSHFCCFPGVTFHSLYCEQVADSSEL